jgi:uncharacterized membrane protein
LIMEKLRSLGRCLFAAALVGFAVQHLMYAHLRTGLGNPWTPQSSLWAYLTGIVLLLAATLLILGRQATSTAAALIATVCFVAAISLHLHGLIANIRDPGPWTSGAELLALCGAALALVGTALASHARDSSPLLIEAGRDLFAITLPVFAVQHFLYAHFVLTIVPPWMPFRLFWAYFVGAAFVAAALAIVTHIHGRLASSLLGVMFLIWVVILHAPRIVASHNGNEWTSGFVALAMSGGAFLVSSTFRRDA